jgi:hypothetical protein
MIKNFSDANLDIFVMARGTDGEHSFRPTLENGSTFVWDQYTVVCEGRLAIANETADFTFPTSYEFDEFGLIDIFFPKELIKTSIREGKVYWRVLATKNDEVGKTILLKQGEAWLK